MPGVPLGPPMLRGGVPALLVPTTLGDPPPLPPLPPVAPPPAWANAGPAVRSNTAAVTSSFFNNTSSSIESSAAESSTRATVRSVGPCSSAATRRWHGDPGKREDRGDHHADLERRCHRQPEDATRLLRPQCAGRRRRAVAVRVARPHLTRVRLPAALHDTVVFWPRASRQASLAIDTSRRRQHHRRPERRRGDCRRCRDWSCTSDDGGAGQSDIASLHLLFRTLVGGFRRVYWILVSSRKCSTAFTPCGPESADGTSRRSSPSRVPRPADGRCRGSATRSRAAHPRGWRSDT